jgi:hypothetical protein
MDYTPIERLDLMAKEFIEKFRWPQSEWDPRQKYQSYSLDA